MIVRRPSPEAYREHVFPWYREMARRCHAKDRIYIMHSDGDLTKLMPDLIDVGIDVLQPIDPSCMDIAKTKQEFGDRICLVGNVPNAFNPRTEIVFRLDREAEVALAVYDLAGRLVRTLVDGRAMEAGRHDETWDGRDESGRTVAAGVYVARVHVGEAQQSIKMSLVK